MRRLSVGPHVAAVVAAFALCLAAAPAFAGVSPVSREAGTAPSDLDGVDPLATVIPGPTAIIQPNSWFSVERNCTMCLLQPQAGSTVTFTVTAIKFLVIGPWTAYAKKVSFSSTDPQATLPPSYTFTGSGAGKDNGVHDFVVTFRTAGPQTLTVFQVSDPDMNGTSDPVTIRAASSHHTSFVAQPVGAAAGSALAAQPVVAIRDQYENRTTSTAAVTLSLVPPAGSEGAALTCLGPGTTVSAVAGTATYEGCAVSVAGVGYTMVATSSGLLSGTSAPFTITEGPSPSPSTSPSPGAAFALASSSTSVSYPGTVTLTAAFAGAGAGRLLAIQQRVAGATDWVQVGTIVTEGAGTGSLPYVPWRTAEYRAVWAGAADLPAATSTSTTVSVRFRIVVTPTAARTVARGTTVSWTATLGPPTAGISVEFRVFRRASTGWVLVATATRTTPASGAVKYSRKMNVLGRWYVQAVALAGPTNLGSTATKRYVTVVQVR